MIADWLKIIAGKSPLPVCPVERADLVEFADAHHVLGQMAVVWRDKSHGKMCDVLENALLRTGFDHRMLQFEMDRVERALQGSGIEPVVLKGGAYVAVGLKAGLGRRVSDLDILVSESEISQAENLFLKFGWVFELAVDNAYDQAYYRKYMHELPPLRHVKRRSVLDVHHHLLPKTSRLKVRTEPMRESAVNIHGRRLKTLAPLDIFIHASVHAFADGAFDTPARSILELHWLLQELEQHETGKLVARAQAVGAAMPVATALWALEAFLTNEKASEILAASETRPAGRLVRYALLQKLQNPDGAFMSKFLLFARSHFLRMPLHLLFTHFCSKTVRSARKLALRGSQTTN